VTAAPHRFSGWKRLALLAALVVLAARLFSAATSELTIDEVWSALWLERSQTFWQAVATRHDNNHPLNTAAMYLVEDAGGASYRWLSVLAGVALVLAAWWRERRRGGASFVLPGLLATALTLTIFSSEARGYMPMLFFAWVARESLLATFPASGSEPPRSALPAAALLFASGVLAFLAHFSFVFWLAGLGAAFVVDVAQARRRDQLATGAALFGVGVVVLALYVGFIRSMELGSWGGGMNAVAAMLLAVAQLLGAYTSSPLGSAVALPALGLLLVLLLRRRTLGDLREAAFFAVAIALAPALVLSVLDESRLPTLGTRYFVGPSFAFLILFARALASTFERLPARALFAAYLALGTAGSVRFAADGRGDYRGALAYMDAHSEHEQVTVSTDHDFRNWILLRHYRHLVRPPRRLVYVTAGLAASRPTEWYLAHGVPGAAAAPEFVQLAGRRYRRVAAFGASELVGFRCTLYHRASERPKAAQGSSRSARGVYTTASKAPGAGASPASR
jgi:hypothetical protein